MRVPVAGDHGYIGAVLVSFLHATGHDVRSPAEVDLPSTRPGQ